MRCIFTLFVLIIVPSEVLVEKFFNNSNEKIIQIARIHGYPIETHHVQTEDGYLLTIYRIPHGRNTNETGESPVLLNHGLLGSAELFITLGPPNALAFLLADSGYDVWLMNARGTWHSRKHKTLKPNQKEFWNFSWHEIGVYDLPACIDLILQTANKSSISFIGQSQGGTTLAVMGSERPEYNSKIKLAIGLSPGIFFKNFKVPLLRFLAMNYKIFEVVTDVSKIYELPPFFFSDANIRAVLETYCVKTTAFKNLCATILNFLFALVRGSYISDEEILQYIYLLSPSSTAINQLFHYAQLIVTTMKLHQLYYLLLCGMLPVSTWKLKEYPYADLSFEDKVAFDGYPLESYQLTTEDNYILTTYRIPHGLKSRTNTTKRSPVLLVHGLGGSIDMFLLLGKHRSLAYTMVDSGFDVWFLNSRGCEKSQRHKYYDLNKDAAYWNFSFHEIAIYDIPRNIDFILEKTKQKPFVIGHSQGNTCAVIMTTERPDYNDKIKMLVLYAPSVYVYLENPIGILFIYALDIFKGFYDLLDLKEMFPYIPGITNMLRDLCKEQTYFITFCYHIINVIGSHPSRILEKDIIPSIVGAIKPRVSIKQLFHYMQNCRSGIFGQYDYGHRQNLKIHKRATPPIYDLNKSTVLKAIFYGQKDDIVSVQGAEETIRYLPNVYFHSKVEYEHFNHIDFLFGKNASELVYQRTVQLFKDFDGTRN